MDYFVIYVSNITLLYQRTCTLLQGYVSSNRHCGFIKYLQDRWRIAVENELTGHLESMCRVHYLVFMLPANTASQSLFFNTFNERSVFPLKQHAQLIPWVHVDLASGRYSSGNANSSPSEYPMCTCWQQINYLTVSARCRANKCQYDTTALVTII